jgi:hypothetical protein
MLKTDLIGPFLTFPLGASFEPQGQNCPPGVKLSPGGEIHCSPLHSSKQYRVFTPGEEQRGKHSPNGQSSPLGVKFTPRGKVHPWGPGVKLRMALRVSPALEPVRIFLVEHPCTPVSRSVWEPFCIPGRTSLV